MDTDIEYEMQVLSEMKRLCALYIDMASDISLHARSENPVLLNAIKMLSSVKDRLSHFCRHEIVEDIVEVGNSIKSVRYCKHCETNF